MTFLDNSMFLLFGGEMACKVSEVHIWYCTLFEFHKGRNATVATKNICDVHKCQKWFKFRSKDVILCDLYWSGRSTTLDNDML